MEKIKNTIAKNISTLRQARGITQLELAETLNYTDKAVSKWERGESVPDVSVLLRLADLFGVSLDTLVRVDATDIPLPQAQNNKKRNHLFITGMSILLVWLVATMLFVIIDLTGVKIFTHWMAFVYAVPVSFVVWLVLNSVWFNRRRNYLIISLLMWSALAVLFLSFLLQGFNVWLIFVLGLPGQLIVLLWSKLK